MAHRELLRRRAGHTASTTSLVHDVYLRLVGQAHLEWRDRAHFYMYACKAMRNLLVDYARQRRAAKHGGSIERVSLEETSALEAAYTHEDGLLALDQALTQLGQHDKQLELIFEQRFFGDRSMEEIAADLGVSSRSVERVWSRTKAYVRSAFAEENPIA